MREIILTNELKERILTPDNFLGKGNEGRVFKYSDSETIKIYYGIFNDYIYHWSRDPFRRRRPLRKVLRACLRT